MEETTKNIRAMSAVFFLCLAFGYIIGSLMSQQKWGLPATETLSGVLLLPTAIIGVVFAASSMLVSLAREEKNSRIALIVTTVVASLAIIGLIAGHFLFSA